MNQEIKKRRPRPRFRLIIESYLTLCWAMVMQVTDRVLLFLAPPRERSAGERQVRQRPAGWSAPGARAATPKNS